MNSRRGVPHYFLPIILFSGIASGIAFHIWLRMFATLFGMHQFSMMSILVTQLFCLAIGSRIGGKLADSMPGRLILFGIWQTVLGLFSLMNPFFFGWLQTTFFQVIRDYQPSSFNLGVIRIALTFLFLFIPMAALGGIFPVLVRNFTYQTGEAGNRISRILSMGTAGIALGLIVSGFYLIPEIGMKSALQVSGLVSLVVSFLTFFIVLRNKTKAVSGSLKSGSEKVKRKSMLFRKNKPVLETGAKLTRAMLRVHAVNGFAGASLLIIASRMLSDYIMIGPFYLQLLTVSVYFAGIAIGGAFYSVITARMVNGYLLMASLEILTSFAILFSVVLLSLTGPLMLKVIINPVHWWKSVIIQLVPVISFLLLPAMITGLLLPLAGRIYPRRLLHTGRNVGRLDFILYSGAIAGIVLSHYLILPVIGSYYACFFLILVALFSGFYLLLRDSRLIRGFRLSYTAIALACITGILFLLVKSGWINTRSGILTESIREVQEGSSARIKLHDKDGDRLTISINGFESLETGPDGFRSQKLPAYLSWIMSDRIQSALVVGFGMGLTASALEDCGIPVIQITEIFPEILTLSSDIFSNENNDILTSSHVDISPEDARLFLSHTSSQFDLITSGYTDIHLVSGFITREFFRQCSGKLTDKGILAQVLPLHGLNFGEFRSIIRSCTLEFPEAELWYISRDNVLLMAGKQAFKNDYCTIANRFRMLEQTGKLSRLGIGDPGFLLGRKILGSVQVKKLVDDAPENRDDKPVIEFSRTPASYTDPAIYRQLSDNMNGPGILGAFSPCTDDPKEIEGNMKGMMESIRKELLSVKGLP